MSIRRTALMVLAHGLAVAVIAGCTVTGVGYDGDVGVGYDAGYYEPYGYDYGGWGGAYRVGPPRGDWRGGGHGPGGDPRGGGGNHPFHSPPPGRSMPSIPGHARGR